MMIELENITTTDLNVSKFNIVVNEEVLKWDLELNPPIIKPELIYLESTNEKI